ncbi:MAG TPA: hypothetical protein VMV92_23940 [Streptosporangiaceae bacterium]|nr:hypothetical protein [Streptosporangiaceae bacterium]
MARTWWCWQCRAASGSGWPARSNATLDVVIASKLAVRSQPGLTLGAIGVGGIQVISDGAADAGHLALGLPGHAVVVAHNSRSTR